MKRTDIDLHHRQNNNHPLLDNLYERKKVNKQIKCKRSSTSLCPNEIYYYTKTYYKIQHTVQIYSPVGYEKIYRYSQNRNLNKSSF